MTRLLTHSVDAGRMLLTQFRGRPRIEAVAEAVGERAQGVEDVLWQVLTLRSLDSATGAQLDGIGAVIGEARQGRIDDVYRLYLRARIRLNISSGTGEDLLAILGLVLAGANRVRLVQTPPASLFVELTGALVDPATDVASIVGAAISAGVRVQLIYNLVGDDVTFAFADGDTPETDAARGCADDAMTAGGQLADVEDCNG